MNDLLFDKLNFTDAERKALENATTEEAKNLIDAKLRQYEESVRSPLNDKIKELREEVDWVSKRTDDEKGRELERAKQELKDLRVNNTMSDIQRRVMSKRGISDIPNIGIFNAMLKTAYEVTPDGKLDIIGSIKDLPDELISATYETALNRWIDAQGVRKSGDSSIGYLDEKARREDAKRQLRNLARRGGNISNEEYERLSRAAGTLDGLDKIADKLRPKWTV